MQNHKEILILYCIDDPAYVLKGKLGAEPRREQPRSRLGHDGAMCSCLLDGSGILNQEFGAFLLDDMNRRGVKLLV